MSLKDEQVHVCVIYHRHLLMDSKYLHGCSSNFCEYCMYRKVPLSCSLCGRDPRCSYYLVKVVTVRCCPLAEEILPFQTERTSSLIDISKRPSPALRDVLDDATTPSSVKKSSYQSNAPRCSLSDVRTPTRNSSAWNQMSGER